MTLSGHSEGISSVAWMDESSICTASWDHSIRLWDLQQATATSIIVGHIQIDNLYIYIYICYTHLVY